MASNMQRMSSQKSQIEKYGTPISVIAEDFPLFTSGKTSIELVLDFYSTELENGTEIISESFSGFYSNSGNGFADRYVKKCIEITRKGGKQE